MSNVTPTVPKTLHRPPDLASPFVVYAQPGLVLNATGFVCGICSTQNNLTGMQLPHPYDGYYACAGCAYTHAWIGGLYAGAFNPSDKTIQSMGVESFTPPTGTPVEDTDYLWTDHDANGWTEAERHAAGESFFPQAMVIPAGGESRGIGPDWAEGTNEYDGYLHAVFIGGVEGPSWQIHTEPA